jgi:O-antigen/teichoic acid export membrane protein
MVALRRRHNLVLVWHIEQATICMVEGLSKVTKDSARGGLFLFSGAAMASVIMAISSIIMGRVLGPVLYGQYTLIIVIPTLMLLFTDFGLNAAVTKFVANARAENNHNHAFVIVRFSLYFRLIICIIITLIGIVFSNYLAILINRPDFGFYIQLASLSVVFQVVYTTANSAFVGFDHSEYNAIVTTTQAVSKTLLQVILVAFGFSVGGALVGFVGGFVIASILGAALLFFKFLRPIKRDFIKSGHALNNAPLGLLARYGLPVYVSVVLMGFFPQYQQIVLAFFSSDAAIGNFRAAFNFITLFTVLSTSITTALLPAFSKLESSKSDVVNLFFNKANKFTCLIIIPIVIAVIIFSKPIVELLYGSSYSSAPLFLSLSCSMYLLSLIGYMTLNSVFNGLGRTRLTMNMTLINFVLLLILSPILAFFYDVVGVIVAYLISSFAASIYAIVVAWRKLNIELNYKMNFKILVVSVFSALPSIGLLFLSSLSPLMFMIVGAVIYLFIFLTLMLLTQIIDKVELLSIGQLVDGLPIIRIMARPVLSYAQKIQNFVLKHKKHI